jgi:hypothetical protein
MSDLFERIDEALIHPGKEDEKSKIYMPARSLSELLCVKTMTAALKEHKKELRNSKQSVKTLTCYVRDEALKTFAILVYIGREKDINQFCKAGFNDTLLPLFRVGSRMTPATKSDSGIVDEAFKKWTSSAKEQFCIAQWKFLAPVFQQGKFHYDIHRECPMPIVEKSTDHRDSTNFSEVEQWVVHRDHLETQTVSL